MQTAHLNFYQRMILWNMVGGQQVPLLKEAAVLYGVLERLRPTDSEMLDTEYVANEQGSSWKLPERGYGEIDLELDGEQARLLVRVIETPLQPQPVRIADAPWIMKLIEQLKEPSTDADRAVAQCG